MAGYEDFIDLKYKPNVRDMLVTFKVKVPSWEKAKRAWGAVASESSIGTWSEMDVSHKYPNVMKVAAKVFKADKKTGWIQIAYPEDHFEQDNISQILASIAGNVYGMKAVDALRIQDIKFTQHMIEKYRGPQFGINGIRKIFKAKKRPLMLSVAKPKVGMTTEQHVEVGRQIWMGGLDLLKDDENLSNQKFNPFKERVIKSLKVRDHCEKKTGDKKSYLINVTAPTVQEMIERAKFVKEQGGEYVMIDIVTSGWMAVNSLREATEDLGLAIHAHRAMHAAFTRNPNHGFSMMAMSKLSRLIGVDQLHTGTSIGKLVSPKYEVDECAAILRDNVTPEKMKINCFEQNWYGLKPAFPVASGGLHPGIVEDIFKLFGTNIMLQLGGGVHGHPQGTLAGAKAMRASVEAYLDGVPVEEAAKKSKELQMALKTWGKTHPK